MPKAWIEISRSALLHNVRSVQRFIKPAHVMAVVKANAYGHGLTQVASVVHQEVKWFGVDSLDEALLLRGAGHEHAMLVLGYIPLGEIRTAIKNNISFVVYNKETAEEVVRHASRRCPARVHLKVETGLHRQGMEPRLFFSVLNILRRKQGVSIEGMSTHFANIEDTRDPSYAHLQLQRFETMIAQTQKRGIDPTWKHCACSAATLVRPETRFNLVRWGISLYGLWSSELVQQMMQEQAPDFSLRPVMTWKTKVAQINSVPKGEPIGYGLTERVSRKSRLAIIPMGYSDGYDRGLSSQGCVLIRGHRCRVVGRIFMNMFIVDVTDLSTVKREDEVVLIGAQGKETITAEEMAKKLGTISYEVVSRVNSLIQRVVVE